MPKWSEYTKKNQPSDNDIMMIEDKDANANKLLTFSGLSDWIVEKLKKNNVISGALKFKGSSSYASLPTNPEQNDYYYSPDGNGTDGAGYYAWNGTAWIFIGNNDKGVDSTFTVEGAAADSKAVGDKFAKVDSETASLKEDIANNNLLSLGNLIKDSFVENGIIKEYSGWSRTGFINVSQFNKICVSATGRNSVYNAFYTKDKKFIDNFAINIGENEITLNNAYYIIMSTETEYLKNYELSVVETKDAHNISKLKEELKEDIIAPYTSTEPSGSAFDTGGDMKPNNRIKSNKLRVFKGDRVKCTDYINYKFYVIEFDKSGSNILYTSDWMKSDYAIKNSGQCVIYIAKINDASFDDVSEFDGKIILMRNDTAIQLYDSIMQLYNSTEELNNISQQAKHTLDSSQKTLTILHFADIHADSAAFERILKQADGLYDDAICAGDIVGNTSNESIEWWNEKVLTCIGNHDCASYSADSGYNWTALTMAERSLKYIEPFEENWNVVHTKGTSYYYKDYKKVRLIVMDTMLYMGTSTRNEASTQTEWLKKLLETAINLDLHVVIVEHAVHGGASPVACSFSKYEATTMPTYQDCDLPDVVVNTVATYINNGLHFIGYLCGHTHQDTIWDANGDKTQLMYCITCANTSYAPQWQQSDQHRGIGFDAFNIVTIDTSRNLIKIIRGGGADIDDHMRSRKAICIDYSKGAIVGEIL